MLSGALAYYPGETITFPNELGLENLVYAIIDNSTEINNLDIQINSTNITITFPSDMTPDSFTIVFIENQTKEVVKTIHSGGSSSTKTKYVDKEVIVNKTIYVDRNITNTETETIYLNNTEVEEPEQVKDKDYDILYIILGCLGVIIVLFLFYRIFFKEVLDEDDEEDNLLDESDINKLTGLITDDE